MKWFYRELTWVFGFKVQGANHYTLEPDDILFVFCLTFGDKRSTFSRENKQTKLHWRFCDNEKET